MGWTHFSSVTEGGPDCKRPACSVSTEAEKNTISGFTMQNYIIGGLNRFAKEQSLNFMKTYCFTTRQPTSLADQKLHFPVISPGINLHQN